VAGEAMERARESADRMYADDQATKALRISIDDVGPGRATARMRVRAEAAERVRMDRNGVYDVSVRRGDGTILAEFRGQSRTVPGWGAA
jgi:acyl-CoA thioesterase